MLSEIEPFLVKVDEACRYLGINRTKLYELVRKDKIKAVKIGKSTRVRMDSIKEFIKGLSFSPSRGLPIKRSAKLTLEELNLLLPSEKEIDMASFTDILNRKASEIKAPPAYPPGSYHCLVDGPPVQEESSQKKTPCRTYKFKILQPMSDVDARLAAEVQVTGKLIAGQMAGTAFYITEDAAYRYKEFLIEHLGIDPDDGNGGEKTILQMEAEAPGKAVIVKLANELSQDNKRVFHRVVSTAHV